MKISVGYDEIGKYVSNKVGRLIRLSYVDESTIKVSTNVEIVVVGVTASLKIKVLELNSKMLKVSYSGGWAGDKLVDWALKLIKMRKDELAESITLYKGERVLVDLQKLPQLTQVLKNIEPTSIRFTPTEIVLEGTLIS